MLSVDMMITSGNIGGGEMVRTLAQNARGVGSNPTPGAICNIKKRKILKDVYCLSRISMNSLVFTSR